jgi:hypothetical protein
VSQQIDQETIDSQCKQIPQNAIFRQMRADIAAMIREIPNETIGTNNVGYCHNRLTGYFVGKIFGNAQVVAKVYEGIADIPALFFRQ